MILLSAPAWAEDIMAEDESCELADLAGDWKGRAYNTFKKGYAQGIGIIRLVGGGP